MANYWETTGMLLHRSEGTYTDDERESVEHLQAFWDEMDNVGPFTEAQRWCRTARHIDLAARKLGRLPTRADGAPPAHLAWIAAQRAAELNSFQRERLQAIQGWAWLSRAELAVLAGGTALPCILDVAQVSREYCAGVIS